MKIRKIIVICIIFLIAGNIHAQCINGTKSYPIYEVGANLVQSYDSAGAEIVRIEYDLIFSSKESYRNLSSDWEYVIIGFADNGVKDLDIKIYEFDNLREDWVLLKKDESSESYATIIFKPAQTAMYKIEIIVYEFYVGFTAARYGLIFVHV